MRITRAGWRNLATGHTEPPCRPHVAPEPGFAHCCSRGKNGSFMGWSGGEKGDLEGRHQSSFPPTCSDAALIQFGGLLHCFLCSSPFFSPEKKQWKIWSHIIQFGPYTWEFYIHIGQLFGSQWPTFYEHHKALFQYYYYLNIKKVQLLRLCPQFRPALNVY